MEVSTLFSSLNVELGIEIVAGNNGTDRRITTPDLQKSGLVLAGFTLMVRSGVLQVLGKTEINYLWSLGPEARKTASQYLTGCAPPAIICTRGLDIPEQLIQAADVARIPLLKTGLRSSLLIESMHKFLANRLARFRSIHGVLVDVFGIGILLIGKSGIGKSESALELVMQGHRLVADDIVDVNLTPPSTIVGSGNELIRHNMEIRGLGIINIKDLFGVSAIRETKRIELVIHIEDWDNARSYDRLGLVTQTHEILGVSIPRIDIPVRPGRTLTTIIEVAARNQIMKMMGHYSAIEFQRKVDLTLEKYPASSRATGHLPHALTDDMIEGDSD